jgi:hypothetical protein
MRGRNNRKGPNPLTRTYESNGPDVKIRGTAHHVAEKYLQLARDAQSSGDPVMAENYLQHAEHYFRLIAAAQQAQQQAQMGYVRQPGEPEADDYDDDDDLGGLPDRFASPAERFPQPAPYQQGQPNVPAAPQQQPQPYMDRQPYSGDRQPQQQPYQGERQDRGDRQDRGERQPRQDRPYQDRNGQNRFDRNRQQRDNRPPREFRTDQPPREQREPRPAPMPEEMAQPSLPAFITSPVRVPVAEPEPQVETVVNGAPQPDVGEAGGYHLRPRRRRRPRAEGEAAGSDAPQSGDVPVAD